MNAQTTVNNEGNDQNSVGQRVLVFKLLHVVIDPLCFHNDHEREEENHKNDPDPHECLAQLPLVFREQYLVNAVVVNLGTCRVPADVDHRSDHQKDNT